jgi:hypothetical protein
MTTISLTIGQSTTTAELSDSCAEEIAQALSDDGEDRAASTIILACGESVLIADDGNAEVEYPEHDTPAAAARAYVEDGDWGEGDELASYWVTIYVWRRWSLGDLVVDEDREAHTIAVEPDEPECSSEDEEHEWVTPHEVLGGIEDNPGCWGHGGGIIQHEVCRHCGLLRTTDTWAQNPETGEQGLTSVEYSPLGDHQFSNAYAEWIGDPE